MRYAIILLTTCAAGCKGDPGPAGTAGERGEQGLRGEKGERGSPGTPGASAKVPHLIALDGTDLGVSISGNCALDPVDGGEVCYGEPFPRLAFLEADCMSNEAVGGVSRGRLSARYIGLGGRLFKHTDIVAHAITKSWLKPDGTCENYAPTMTQQPEPRLVATGARVTPRAQQDLSIELR